MSFNQFLFFIRQEFSNWLANLNPSNFLHSIDANFIFEGVYHQTITGLLPVIGYGLFFASLGDYLYLLFPLQLQNPAWELQTLGALVEQSWGFLVSLALIFSRYFLDNQNNVRYLELILLKLIRWLVLTMALFFILATPLILLDTHRLRQSIAVQISRADQVKLAQIADLNNKIGQINDLNQIVSAGRLLGLDPQKLTQRSLDDARKALQDRLTALKAETETKVQNNRRAQTIQLFKSSFRTLYAGLIISFIFIFIWFKIGALRDRL